VDAENKSTVVIYCQKASSLEADLAGARGRLGAVEESLAASRVRCAQLETTLSVARPDVARGYGAAMNRRRESTWCGTDQT
jgi:hypothetical protein